MSNTKTKTKTLHNNIGFVLLLLVGVATTTVIASPLPLAAIQTSTVTSTVTTTNTDDLIPVVPPVAYYPAITAVDDTGGTSVHILGNARDNDNNDYDYDYDYDFNSADTERIVGGEIADVGEYPYFGALCCVASSCVVLHRVVLCCTIYSRFDVNSIWLRCEL